MVTTTPVSTKIFRFDQNNSGGSYDEDHSRGIGSNVYIEAVDALHANARAESIGIYFDGCEKGMDCDCCGDRWCPVYDGGWDQYDDLDALKKNKYSRSGYYHPLSGPFEYFEKEYE